MMCVADGRAAFFSRPAFLAAVAGVAAPLIAGSAGLEDAAAAAGVPRVALLEPRLPLTRGDAAAASLARDSNLVAATYSRVEALVSSVGDRTLRTALFELVRDPHPLYADRHPSPASRTAVRDALARAGFVAATAPVRGIFPPATEPGATTAPQPFWAAPGSGESSHHDYPGGLALHETFNASVADNIAAQYDAHYFGGRPTIARDTVIAAALYHDVMKTVVFGWNDDGTVFDELEIAGTGGHHVLSAAEAIARGHDPRFVTTLLSAHAAPSLGDEAKVVAWCRAAAIVANVDPVAYGLLKRDGAAYALGANPVPLEAFVHHLSDHDYVISVHAMHVVAARLQQRYSRFRGLAELAPTFAWYRAMILTRTTALALYDTLARNGADAFDRTVVRVESQLAPLHV
ncbi:MAG: hypothetical protein QOJ39_3607 [Candidatus Eremiobacteraeota bacterium]|jgi:hypothetical protein|nr:hypothetical protein [Candidatus Eremiobacteraeota bacterium]